MCSGRCRHFTFGLHRCSDVRFWRRFDSSPPFHQSRAQSRVNWLAHRIKRRRGLSPATFALKLNQGPTFVVTNPTVLLAGMCYRSLDRMFPAPHLLRVPSLDGFAAGSMEGILLRLPPRLVRPGTWNWFLSAAVVSLVYAAFQTQRRGMTRRATAEAIVDGRVRSKAVRRWNHRWSEVHDLVLQGLQG